MKNNAITCSNKGWNTLALNHCMADDLIEAIWILAFLRYLEAHIVSVGNIQTCVYPAINHCTSKPPQVFILKLTNAFWFPETKKAEKYSKLRISPTSEQGPSELASVFHLCNSKMSVLSPSVLVNGKMFIHIYLFLQ